MHIRNLIELYNIEVTVRYSGRNINMYKNVCHWVTGTWNMFTDRDVGKYIEKKRFRFESILEWVFHFQVHVESKIWFIGVTDK